MKSVIFGLLITISSLSYAVDSRVNLYTLKIEKTIEKADLSKIQEYEIDVENPAKEDVKIKLQLLHPQFALKKQMDISLDKYVLDKDKIVVLKAGERKKVKIGLKLPDSLQGSLYVFFGYDVIDVKAQKGAIKFEMVQYGQMTISVNNTLKKEVSLSSEFKNEKDKSMVKIVMKNIGNTYIRRIEGYCLIQDNKNNLIGKFPLTAKDGSYLFQTNERVFSALINQKLKGKYKLSIIFNNHDGDFNKIEQKDISI
jgi:hypothetical protein